MACLLAESIFTSTHHAIVLVVCAALTAGVLWYGRRGTRPQALARRYLALAGIGVWLASGVFYSIPPQLKPYESLPIQACDILALIAPLALIRPTRLLRAMVYFGAFGLTLQAFLTPVIDTGPDTLKFYIFWSLHLSIILCALFDLVVGGYRPTGRDLLRAIAAWAVYAVGMIVLNYPTGWYYGYLGPEIPPNAANTILKYLGPWPIRPLSMMLLATTLFVLLWLPWVIFPQKQKDA